MTNDKLIELRNRLRVGQQPLADWNGGKLAVSAVPGAGKSTGMAIGAAIAIVRQSLNPKRQLIVVTFTRSAAASIKTKISGYLKELGYPSGGFTIHTLHGLALNIASRYPNLSGLDPETTTLVSPNQNHRLIKDTVEQWISRYPQYYKTLLQGVSFDGEETERLRRQSVLQTEVLPKLTRTAVQEAKSSGLSPETLWELSWQSKDEYNILAITAGLYEIYGHIARSRRLIDYDDMILGALRVLEVPSVAQQLQEQTYGVFEDEAQDSTPLQGKLLEILASCPNNSDTPPNLVRVGDPNQAINSTFTPADPLYFRDFCETCQSENRLAEMDQAGRSSPIIIEVANYFLRWGNQNHPQEVPFRVQDIHTVSADDPQPDANPQPTGKGFEIHTPIDIHQTVQWMGNRLQKLLTDNPDHNAAILVRNNRQGNFLAQALNDLQHDHHIPVYEVSQSERSSHIPTEILRLLQFLSRPHSPEYTKATLEVLTQRNLIPKQDLNALATYPEQFLYPSPLDLPQSKSVQKAGHYCRSLLKARLELPTYQLISFLGLTLNYSSSELATVHKLAGRVRQETQGRSSLMQIIETLSEIVNSERFEGIEEDSDDQYVKRGQVTIITMHKAKGLDWDYVFLPFLHQDNLPGQHRVPTPSKFLGDFTLSEVARSQIRNVVHSQYQQQPITLTQPAQAWEKAGELQTAEEYRLFYVAMTRAKRLLWLSAAENAPFRWNQFNLKGANSLQKKDASPFLPALEKQFPEASSG
ncbi:MAG: DNA helicase UvrD [Cyanobacteria bacterium SW_9_44_58]|nr:MAG: DNA helicase UvrD [Cyanobacteria bacterium SW_9_44_58]